MRDLIVYQEPATWMPLVHDFLGPQLHPGGLAWRRKRRLDRMDIDDPDWLRLLASGLKVELDSVEMEFASILESRSVLGYHGCRPHDLITYLTDGVKAFDSSDLMRLLRDAVEQLSDPELGDEILCAPADITLSTGASGCARCSQKIAHCFASLVSPHY